MDWNPIDFRNAGTRGAVPQATPGNGQGRAPAPAAPASARDGAPATQTQAALDRLTRLLDSGRPLRQDVPRGYHLNIRI
jgi:hypothetical protein